ncbi:MAG: hydroxymethylglutaryl-CoA lyase [Gammaproteobacteria bacterium]|nr:hydroxymethylglutaryl-CoA lyase [Gammaproteobacteria bacterium]
MSDLPAAVHIHEEGPREGFQIEPGPIATARKIELIDALSGTGLKHIQVASFVNPKRVPGWADADQVVAGFERVPGVHYSALWLNEKGLERALGVGDLHMRGSLSTSASESFMQRNTNRDYARNLEVQRNQIALYKQHGVDVSRIGVMAAFGCNYEGEIGLDKVERAVRQMLDLAAEEGLRVSLLSLADTMGWATPRAIERVVGGMRERWPELRISLHLHDTRGQGIVNAYAGLRLGVDSFDASVAGLGGCPFAALKGAAGNVCTEDLVFMCEEMGIATGVDLDRLIEAARLAEDIVGHPLPGSIMRGGSLNEIRGATRG